jgi:hypothetical protein
MPDFSYTKVNGISPIPIITNECWLDTDEDIPETL